MHVVLFVVCMYTVLFMLCYITPSSVGIPVDVYLAAIKFSCCQLCYENVLLVVKEKITKFNELPG